MKIKNNKGITGVDVTIAIVILGLFVSLITSMFYNVATMSKSVDRKTEATYIAVQVIESLKQVGYSNLPEGHTVTAEDGTETENTTMTFEALNTLLGEEKEIEVKNGYSVEDILIENYRQIKQDLTLEDILKKVTVTIKYTEKDEEKEVELSTVIINEEY